MSQKTPKPISGEELREIAEETEKNLRKQVRYLKSYNIIRIDLDYPYEIDMRRVKTKSDVLKWVLHLSGKTWMTFPALERFIELACRVNGLDPYNNEPLPLLDQWFLHHPEISAPELANLEEISPRKARKKLSALVAEGMLVVSKTEGRKKFYAPRMAIGGQPLFSNSNQ